jgi:hypothetical protein
MQAFKELVIQKTPNGILAQLPLTGKWLEEIGFTVGVAVSVVFADSCLTLTTNTAIKADYGVLMVENRFIRNRPRTQLLLNGFLLKKYGLNVGDRVGLHLSPYKIQISKINRFTTEQPTIA